MKTSLPPLSLKAGFKIWSDEEDVSIPGESEHLSAVEFLRFTAPGGMENAPQKRKDHLSICSLCQQKWFDISEELSFADDLSEENSSDDWFAGGMLEAAAGQVASALSLKSRCGNFQLNLYPDSSHRGEGMIALEFVGSSGRDIEGKWVTVKDIEGLVLIDGSIRAGRVATISHNFTIMDLQAWSVHVHSGTNNGRSE